MGIIQNKKNYNSQYGIEAKPLGFYNNGLCN